jgi:hypothetical protein
MFAYMLLRREGDSSLTENPCADGSTFVNNTLVNSSQNICN